MRVAVPDNVKKLRGTFAPSRARPSQARLPSRLEYAVRPPRDFSPEMKRQWNDHMAAIIAAGRTTPSDLLAFRQLCRAAVLAETGFAEAVRSGPTVTTEEGPKSSPAWRSYVAADAAYRGWLIQFGLAPRARGSVQALPGLAVLEGGAGGQ
jgi:hypothetical protein